MSVFVVPVVEIAIAMVPRETVFDDAVDMVVVVNWRSLHGGCELEV